MDQYENAEEARPQKHTRSGTVMNIGGGNNPPGPDALENAIASAVGEEALPNVAKEGRVFAISLLCIEVGLIIVYLSADVTYTAALPFTSQILQWSILRDVSFMVLFGFAFLMTFLRRYGQSAIGYTFLILALTVQWSVLVRNAFKGEHEINDVHILEGVFCAAAILVSFGVVLGRLSPLEILVLVACETLCWNLNLWFSVDDQKAYDVGGGATIHMFGAYFGLAMSKTLGDSSKARNHNDNASTYSSDLFSLCGTLVLWSYWPSFNAAVTGQANGWEYATVNTYMSISSSVITAVITTRLIQSQGRFNVVHIQNATLAGGVAMGVIADVNMLPAVAMAVGGFTGIVSVLGFRFVTPFLDSRLGIQDVCGVHNLHGLPGLISVVFAIIAAQPIEDKNPGTFPDDVVGKEVILLISGLVVALVGGSVTGILMRVVRHFVHTIPKRDIFNDRAFWEIPTDYSWVVGPQNDADEEANSVQLAAPTNDNSV